MTDRHICCEHAFMLEKERDRLQREVERLERHLGMGHMVGREGVKLRRGGKERSVLEVSGDAG